MSDRKEFNGKLDVPNTGPTGYTGNPYRLVGATLTTPGGGSSYTVLRNKGCHIVVQSHSTGKYSALTHGATHWAILRGDLRLG